MLNKLQAILKRNRDSIVRDWALNLTESMETYRRRPIYELSDTLRKAVDANMDYMFLNDKASLDNFTDFIVERRFKAGFRLSEVQAAIQVFREVVRPIILENLSNDEIEDGLRTLDGCIHYSIRRFSEKFQAKHAAEIVHVNQALSNALGALKIEKNNVIAANRLKDQFLSNVSHELKTPLTSIIGFSKVLMDSFPSDDSTCDQLRIVNQQGKALSRMIDTLILISEIDAGTAQVRKDSIEICGLIEEAISKVKKEKAADKHSIAFICREEIPPMMGDYEKLYEVFCELILNSLKFSKPGSTVEVEARLDASILFVCVKDEGIGMDNDHINSIFTPFLQIDGSITRKQGGSGLGLTLIKKVVELHGGTISVESAPEKGSIFTIRLPFLPSKSHLG